MCQGDMSFCDVPGVQTPQDVLSTLSHAFGGDLIGETGYDIAAAQCCTEAEKDVAKQRGNSLLYGELLPDGVSKALTPGRLGGALQGRSIVLELGMGSGKVAMQVFLQYPEVAHVLGVELVPSRYAIAASALRRLVARRPETYREVAPTALNHVTGDVGDAACLEECSSTQGSRKLEFRCDDFFNLGLDLVAQSDVILFAVHIPCKLFPQLCHTLSNAKEGCRLFSYHCLSSIWWSDAPCPFRHCEENMPETDQFSTSWSPQGYRFHVYVADRSQEIPEIASGVRNETFSEWKVVQDPESGSCYYHNEETEESQWEKPEHAGCWKVEWSHEWNSHYYHHQPTGHTQWEVPQCLADLGWTTST